LLATKHESLANVKPQWIKERDGHTVGELLFAGQVVRRVRSIANTLIPILDAFEEEGWPPTIFDPLTPPNQQKRLDAISTLNKNLRVIEFHADGTNEGISWKLCNLPDIS
jgi:hypothetical protein